MTEDWRFYSGFVLQKVAAAPAAAPPADKKARMDKTSDEFSLDAAVSSLPSKVFSHWRIPAAKFK